MEESDRCCGFGGVFSVKYPQISCKMTERKVERILATGASYVTSGDLGCLLSIGGLISRIGYPVKAIHLAEILAGKTGRLSSFASDAASEDARPPGILRRAGGR